MYTKEINEFYDAIIDTNDDPKKDVFGVMYKKLAERHPVIHAVHFEVVNALRGKAHYEGLSAKSRIDLIRRAMHLRMQLQEIYDGNDS